MSTDELLQFLVRTRTTKQMRRITYDRISAENGGQVPCFVCGHHVEWKISTLEHILAKDNGGTNAESNLAISHCKCNNLKANHIM